MVGDVFQIPILIIIAFCVYMFAFAISAGGVIYVYSTEIVPAKLLAFPMLLQSVLTVIIGAVTLRLINSYGIYPLYIAFATFAMLGWLLFQGYAIETKRKENSQIISEFREKTFMG